MCTLTWRRDKLTGLEVYFNRDELKSRPIAHPPEVRTIHGVSFVSPQDPSGGGTWMLANEYGILVCLLNKWELDNPVPRRSGSRKSRGQLVWSMAEARNFSEVEALLGNPSAYPAFTLAAFAGNEERFWEWNGGKLERAPLQMPVTSSSYSFETVKAAREAAYRGGLRGGEYHASAHEAPSACSVRMCRADAQTWSRSVVRMGAKVSWEYLAEQPDLDGEPQRTFVELALR